MPEKPDDLITLTRAELKAKCSRYFLLGAASIAVPTTLILFFLGHLLNHLAH